MYDTPSDTVLRAIVFLPILGALMYYVLMHCTVPADAGNTCEPRIGLRIGVCAVLLVLSAVLTASVPDSWWAAVRSALHTL